MMQNKWFKIFTWFIATTYFFAVSAILISSMGPKATEAQVMKFMPGMMSCMSSSLMGFSMTIEQDQNLKMLIGEASTILIPLIAMAIIAGIFIRIRGNKNAV